MTDCIRKVPLEEAFSLAAEVDYLDDQVVSKTLAQNDALSLTIFAFDKDTEISSHKSEGDAMVTALDGEGCITIDGTAHPLKSGESIVMPAGKPHAIYATECFKMFLVVVFPSDAV